MTKPIVRFAPSPTGLIHIGNARPALLNALFARREGGVFILRFDDTDLERSKREYADAIEVDLAWLGIPPDVVVRQSERFALYDDAAERLRDLGRLYACYETAGGARVPPQAPARPRPAADLRPRRPEAHRRGPGEARGGGPPAALALPARPPRSWPGTTSCAVRAMWIARSLSDPVLVREDGTYLYTLPSVVDDIDLDDHPRDPGRGPRHQHGGADPDLRGPRRAPPLFAHHNLLTTASGEGLSKRLGHLSLKSLREAGLEPQAVASLAVLVGSAEAVRPVADLDELARLIDFAHISRAPGQVRRARAGAAQRPPRARDCPMRPSATASRRSGADGGEAFWLAVRGNLTKVADAAQWWQVVRGPVTPVIEDRAFIDAAARGAAAGALGRFDLEGLDRGRQGRDRRRRARRCSCPCASP